jgi:hypothetical protein
MRESKASILGEFRSILHIFLMTEDKRIVIYEFTEYYNTPTPFDVCL